jgi:hypothetical protein
MDHIRRACGPISEGDTAMRKLITTAITATTLITIVWGTAAYAVLSQPQFAAPAASVHNLSTHVGHDGRALRPAHAPLFML